MNIIKKHNDVLAGVFGDIHGKFQIIMDKIKLYNLSDLVLFQSGDFGVGFNNNDSVFLSKEKTQLKMLNSFLKKRNVFLYVIRGNHDNPAFFDGNHNFSNIIFMQDYDVVEVGKNKYLGIGGAISVDRKTNPNFPNLVGKPYPGRKNGINWWKDEGVVYNEEKLNEMTGIKVVITHTCPSFAYPQNLHSEFILKWIEYDPELEEELLKERLLLTKIYNKLSERNTLLQWFYGHFHESKFEEHYQTKFNLVDINEFRDIRI